MLVYLTQLITELPHYLEKGVAAKKKDHFLPWNWDLSSVLGPKGTLSRADGESRCPCLN